MTIQLPTDFDRLPEWRRLKMEVGAAAATAALVALFRELVYLERSGLSPGLIPADHHDSVLVAVNDAVGEAAVIQSGHLEESGIVQVSPEAGDWRCPIWVQCQSAPTKAAPHQALGNRISRLGAATRRLEQNPTLALVVDPAAFQIEGQEKALNGEQQQAVMWFIHALDHALDQPQREPSEVRSSLVRDAYAALQRTGGKDGVKTCLKRIATRKVTNPALLAGVRTESLLADWDGWMQRLA